MMTSLCFGAVDVGSNAARLLIASQECGAKKIAPRQVMFVRVPLRLGEDVFSKGEIGPERVGKLFAAMRAFKELLGVCEVKAFRVCATAALREAKNRSRIVARIKKETGLNMEVIDGREEARIIYESHVADYLEAKRRYIYVDVGGGSTECTLIENKCMSDSQSFNIGTLRILAGKVEPTEWQRLDSWLESLPKSRKPLEIIGSGGNINKLYRMISPDTPGKMSVAKLKKVYQQIKRMDVSKRIQSLGLRPDRADVIAPAAELFLHIAAVAGVETYNIPTMGLADGIIHSLCRTHCA